MKVCARCGTKLDKKAVFCGNCGSQESTETNMFGMKVPQKNKKCLNCGETLEQKAKFCWHCGKPCDGTVSFSFMDSNPPEPPVAQEEETETEAGPVGTSEKIPEEPSEAVLSGQGGAAEEHNDARETCDVPSLSFLSPQGSE